MLLWSSYLWGDSIARIGISLLCQHWKNHHRYDHIHPHTLLVGCIMSRCRSFHWQISKHSTTLKSSRGQKCECYQSFVPAREVVRFVWAAGLPLLAIFKAACTQFWQFVSLTCRLQLTAEQITLDLTWESSAILLDPIIRILYTVIHQLFHLSTDMKYTMEQLDLGVFLLVQRLWARNW